MSSSKDSAATVAVSDVGTNTRKLVNEFRAFVDAYSPARLVVAFSGGADSSALLDIACRAVAPGVSLSAVHFNHRLQPGCDHWVEHCARFCAARNIPLTVVDADERPPSKSNLEAWARARRYAAFERFAQTGSYILTAHHRDDQAETVLMRAFRGSGSYGMSGIARLHPFGEGHLARPFLAIPGDELKAYVRDHNIEVVLDPSNNDLNFERNKVRRLLLPLLAEHFPNAVNGLTRVAVLQDELSQFADETLGLKVQPYANDPRNALPLALLRSEKPAVQALLIRFWVRSKGFPMPAPRHVNELLRSIAEYRGRSSPQVSWRDACIYLFEDKLFLAGRPDLRRQQPCQWLGEREMQLPTGTLTVTRCKGSGLSIDRFRSASIEIGYRRGGERIQLPGRSHSQSLKKLFWEWRVPPWERGLVPLLSIGDELAAVANHAIAKDYVATGEEEGLVFSWSPHIYKGVSDGSLLTYGAS
ncbi:MAG: tRNA lysidine(34) synthetase TilS [Pseudomonadota bacterium]